jgi:hypothetical protein
MRDNPLGNGVTVAYQISGYPVDISELVSQLPPFLIRLFPGTSDGFARLFAGARLAFTASHAHARFWISERLIESLAMSSPRTVLKICQCLALTNADKRG